MKHMSQSVQASTIGGKSSDFTPSHFAFGRCIDQIEQAREGIAEIEAAPAAVTDVEDAPHLGVELLGVGEVGIAPVDRVARGRFKAAFAGHAVNPLK